MVYVYAPAFFGCFFVKFDTAMGGGGGGSSETREPRFLNFEYKALNSGKTWCIFIENGVLMVLVKMVY